jgi:selenocysteine-specific elongation factor
MDKQACQINITLGTAGHIDHGKTALIKLLTGCETDRLKQEKERGMSIELGFAPCHLGDLEVGIVDVPGHENFIKTMVAGAASIDGVIFVVAADDSVMPQTREHLDILTLLGVKHGMVALTKIDLVELDWVEAVIEDLTQFLQGTFLEDTPICPMSSITGAGFDGFYTALKQMIRGITPRSTEGVFRQPVERAFSAKGFGTITSGVPVSGAARVGDEAVLLPQGKKSRIKAIQVYGRDADRVQSGQCAALNLPQIDYKTVQRGNVLCQNGYFRTALWYVCTLTLLDTETVPVKNGAQLKFHTGTSEVSASIYLLESDLVQPGLSTYVQIRTEQPIITGPGDRFILRSPSPAHTLGGGMIIEALPRKLKRTKEGMLDDIRARARAVPQAQSFVEYVIQHATGSAAKLPEIAERTKLLPEQTSQCIRVLIKQGNILEIAPKTYMHAETCSLASDHLADRIEQYHQGKPDSLGVDKESLMEQSGLKRPIFEGVLSRLLQEQKLVLRKDRLALYAHTEQFSPEVKRLLNAVTSLYQQNPFRPPKIAEVISELRKSQGEINKAIGILTEQQMLIRVEQDLYFHADAIAEAKQRCITYIKGEGGGQLESVQFKYLLDTTRKYAIPLLDYMDKIGVTRRVGNTRYLKDSS